MHDIVSSEEANFLPVKRRLRRKISEIFDATGMDGHS